MFLSPLVNSYPRTNCVRTGAGIFTGSEPWSVVNAGIYSGGTGAVPVIDFEEKLQLYTYCTYPFLTSRLWMLGNKRRLQSIWKVSPARILVCTGLKVPNRVVVVPVAAVMSDTTFCRSQWHCLYVKTRHFYLQEILFYFMHYFMRCKRILCKRKYWTWELIGGD